LNRPFRSDPGQRSRIDVSRLITRALAKLREEISAD